MNDPVPVTTEGDDEDQIDGCDVDCDGESVQCTPDEELPASDGGVA